MIDALIVYKNKLSGENEPLSGKTETKSFRNAQEYFAWFDKHRDVIHYTKTKNLRPTENERKKRQNEPATATRLL